MAKIGLQNFLFGILTEAQDGTPTYGVAHKPAKAISCNVSISNNDATLYADGNPNSAFVFGTARKFEVEIFLLHFLSCTSCSIGRNIHFNDVFISKALTAITL